MINGVQYMNQKVKEYRASETVGVVKPGNKPHFNKNDAIHLDGALLNDSTNTNQGITGQVPFNLKDELGSRKSHVRDLCAKLHTRDVDLDNVDLENLTASTTLYVEDRYKFLYCPIHKVATSNWRRVLMVLAGDVRNESMVGKSHYHDYTSRHMPLKKYPPEERIKRLKTYKKFMFVRHPFERLLSAYRDKFEMGVKHQEWWYMETFGVPIKKWAHPEMSPRELRAQRTNVTFAEFIGYVVAYANTKRIDMHWEQYHKLCRPCDIEYDIIGKYETLERDSNYVLNAVNAADKVHFPSVKLDNHRTYTSADMILKYLSKLSDEQLKNLRQTYSLDFELFDYDFM
ncbi:carbohydrate sulfotransferase 9-like isoform X2 [Ptychodera flava]